MQFGTTHLFKTLSLTGLLLAASHSQAGTICIGGCTPDPVYTTETLHYSYAGYLTDLTVMAEQTLPISLSRFYQSLGVVSGQPVAFSASIEVLHTTGSNGTNSFAYNYSVSFGGISVFGPGTALHKAGSPFQNDYDFEYDDEGALDSVTLNTQSFRVESTDTAIALRSNTPEDVFDGFSDRFFLTMTDTTAQAFAGALPPDGTAFETLFADGRFYLKGGIEIRDENGILIPFGAAKGDVWLSGVFSSALASLAPSRDVIQVNACGNLDLPCVTFPTPQVPIPGAGVLFASGLLGIGAAARRRRVRL